MQLKSSGSEDIEQIDRRESFANQRFEFCQSLRGRRVAALDNQSIFLVRHLGIGRERLVSRLGLYVNHLVGSPIAHSPPQLPNSHSRRLIDCNGHHKLKTRSQKFRYSFSDLAGHRFKRKRGLRNILGGEADRN